MGKEDAPATEAGAAPATAGAAKPGDDAQGGEKGEEVQPKEDAKEEVKEEAAESGSKAATADGDADGDDDDDDDDGDDGEPAKPVEEEAGGEEVEVTKWAEKGVGQVRLLVPKPGRGEEAPACPRLVMRVEHVGRLILNQPLRPTTAPAERVSDTSIRLVVVSAGADDSTPQIQSYLFRVKTPAEAEMLVSHINSSIPPADSS